MANKKISELSGTTSPSLAALTVVVDGGATLNTNLQTLRNVLVDSGSHYFTGSQTINGNLVISGSLTAQQYILSSSVTNMVIETVSGSTAFGNSLDDTHNFTGSLKVTGSSNLIGNQIISGSIYISENNGNEIKFGPFASIGLGEGSLYIDDKSGYIVLAPYDESNQSTLFNVKSRTNDNEILRLSNSGGVQPLLTFDKSGSLNIDAISGTGSLLINNVRYDAHLATTGSNTFVGNQDITGSLNVTGSVTASYFVGDGSQLTNVYATPTNVSMFLSSSVFNLFTSSFQQTASYLATTGSNNFNGNQNIFGDVVITGSLIVSSSSTFSNIGPASFSGNTIIDGNLDISGSQQNEGLLAVTGSLIVSGTLQLTGSLTVSASNLSIYGSGSATPLFSVNGSTGTILTAYDELTGSLWSINDISGNSVFEAMADSRIFMGNSQSRLLMTTVKSTLAAIPNNIVYTNIPTSNYNVVYYDYLISSASNWKVGELIAMWDGTTVNTSDTTKISVGTTSGVTFSVTGSAGNLILSASASTAGWTTKVLIKAI